MVIPTKLIDEEKRERRAEYAREWRAKNREKVNREARERRVRDVKKIRENARARYQKNREKVAAQNREQHQKNRARRLAAMRDYHQENSDRIYARRLTKYHIDMAYKLSVLLRTRMRHAVRGSAKRGSAVRDLGCTIDDLRTHLEAQFVGGMTWDNWALDGWHIDHIQPLASFDLTDRKQFLAACHYTNLQPLWAADNLSKGAHVPAKN